MSGIKMAFENGTIWHAASFQSSEYQMSLVFKSPLHSNPGDQMVSEFRCHDEEKLSNLNLM